MSLRRLGYIIAIMIVFNSILMKQARSDSILRLGDDGKWRPEVAECIITAEYPNVIAYLTFNQSLKRIDKASFFLPYKEIRNFGGKIEEVEVKLKTKKDEQEATRTLDKWKKLGTAAMFTDKKGRVSFFYCAYFHWNPPSGYVMAGGEDLGESSFSIQTGSRKLELRPSDIDILAPIDNQTAEYKLKRGEEIVGSLPEKILSGKNFIWLIKGSSIDGLQEVSQKVLDSESIVFGTAQEIEKKEAAILKNIGVK